MKTLLPAIALSLLLTGCADVYEQVIAPGLDYHMEQSGYSAQERQAVARIGRSFVKSVEEITPEQEYYVGRTVSANILSRYKPYRNEQAHAYLNKIGTLLSYHSDKPATYGGYHFMILDSDEINAFAAPGGFIFVTRGMLRCTDSEDAVAAILAHEIAHVTHQHGLSTIKSSRWAELGTILSVEAAKRYSNEELDSLVMVFEQSIDDIIITMVVNGYSREYERQADLSALKMLGNLGYDPSALTGMLKLMEQRLKPGGGDFARTHPDPADRIASVQRHISYRQQIPAARQVRYNQALSGI